jgi:hypothetical protein
MAQYKSCVAMNGIHVAGKQGRIPAKRAYRSITQVTIGVFLTISKVNSLGHGQDSP